MPTRELVFFEAGKLAWREVPSPTLQSDGDALVRPFIAARCDADPFYWRHNFGKALRVGARLHVIDDGFRSAKTDPFAGPFAYGHECVAEVLSVGSEVRSLSSTSWRRI